MRRLSKKKITMILYGLRFLLGERSDENISCKAAAVCCWKESVGGGGSLTRQWASGRAETNKKSCFSSFWFICSRFLCVRRCFTTGTDEENKTSWCSLGPTSTFNFLNCCKLSDCSALPHPSQFGLLLKPGNTLTWIQQRWTFLPQRWKFVFTQKKNQKWNNFCFNSARKDEY